MARLSIHLVLLIALGVAVLSAPPTAACCHNDYNFLRQPIYSSYFHRRASSDHEVMCVGEVAELLQQHEGRNRSVFADIQHTAGSVDKFPKEDMDQIIERMASEDYKTAAHELKHTIWCSKSRHRS
ncbi:hypothetical protein R1sor_015516 [Riccia sorocarpa]|uniref:Uncharacterized protein n=1 Tax=Riccia sorocarpa TaxID=122646 RepID=A0ABD3HCG2_9MARC